ncbi:uncharacterized protein LOC126854282 [Cataglyphis hispanica]|uniref:uncharacterized protein LOC126854282 n=1 Tax=Cataglyphis hispanica TaxID=1086592 RepID=UPI00217FF3C6|nr:uncharacterized protein LOC126854282 [Cataglyphis hispanica]
MKHQSLYRFALALITAIEVTSIPIRNFELGKTVWQNIGKRSFYGPWDISVKRNGDYVDYNDYGARIKQFRPNNLLSYDDVSISNGYIDALSPPYDNSLPEFNTLLNSVGLADFRIGVRTGDWIDRNTDSSKERSSEDIASQKIDEDTEV